jgi:hypothetical protein
MYDPSAPVECINDEEIAVGIKFSSKLREFLLVINGMEYLDDWMFYSVLNKKNPKAKYGYFRIENQASDYRLVPTDLFIVAADGSGNHLVVQVNNGVMTDELLYWNHETRKIKKSAVTFDKAIKLARKQIEKINKIHEKRGIY